MTVGVPGLGPVGGPSGGSAGPARTAVRRVGLRPAADRAGRLVAGTECVLPADRTAGRLAYRVPRGQPVRRPGGRGRVRRPGNRLAAAPPAPRRLSTKSRKRKSTLTGAAVLMGGTGL